MKISVFGLGYVGCVSAACLAGEGHHVIGVDINPVKVKEINSGKSPILEKGLEKLIAETVLDRKLSATLDYKEAVLNSDVSFLCVGTPSNNNGSISLKFLEKVAKEIGISLKRKRKGHLIVNRSTALPGSLNQLRKIIEQTSNKIIGRDVHLAVNPEFLREGSAVKDFYEPPYTLVGCDNNFSKDILRNIYSFLKVPFIVVSNEEAELIKYINNSFHALKITFANEIGRLSKSLGIDSQKIMKIVMADTKLNLSPCYLTPGFAFGGSCLPKDLRAINYFAKHRDVDIPLIQNILISNDHHLNYTFNLINQMGRSTIGFIGLSFKPNTDDLRESPAVNLAERLIGKGNEILIYDQNVYKNRLIGSNKEFILKHLPHFFKLLTDDIKELIKRSDILIIVQPFDILLKNTKLLSSKIIIDLFGIDELKFSCGEYFGICW
jgi:GDP-mannose 6-dehydrogenase